VVVAGGVWNDRIESLTKPTAMPRLRPSNGVHVALRREDVPLGAAACFIPDAERKRMIFLVPWNDVVLVGHHRHGLRSATRLPQSHHRRAVVLPRCLERRTGAFSGRERDVVSAWAVLRPLVRAERDSTVDLSRSHAVYEFAPGIVGITGGKLTTYRRMAQDAVDRIAPAFGRVGRSRTCWIKLGCSDVGALTDAVGRRAERVGIAPECVPRLVRCYGDRALAVLDVAAETGLTEPLGPGGHLGAEVFYSARCEMAVQLSDLLARRTRLALTTSDGGLESDELGLLAAELSWSSAEAERQEMAYRSEVEAERGMPLPRRIGALGARA
jgi:glycerol-3-phosphate dehydrogenase